MQCRDSDPGAEEKDARNRPSDRPYRINVNYFLPQMVGKVGIGGCVVGTQVTEDPDFIGHFGAVEIALTRSKPRHLTLDERAKTSNL